MKDHPICPCPLSLHSNNGFDIARKMKYKASKSHPKTAARKYIAQTDPANSAKIIFKLKRPPMDCKVIAAAAIILLTTGVWLTLKFSLKILVGAMCGIPLILLLCGVSFLPQPVKFMPSKLTEQTIADL